MLNYFLLWCFLGNYCSYSKLHWQTYQYVLQLSSGSNSPEDHQEFASAQGGFQSGKSSVTDLLAITYTWLEINVHKWTDNTLFPSNG